MDLPTYIAFHYFLVLGYLAAYFEFYTLPFFFFSFACVFGSYSEGLIFESDIRYMFLTQYVFFCAFYIVYYAFVDPDVLIRKDPDTIAQDHGQRP